MFQLVVFSVMVAATAAKPVYPGGMGGVGTVSVTRTTEMISPGGLSEGMIRSPGMLGAGMMRNPVMFAKTINTPMGETEMVEETVIQEVVEPRMLTPGVTETIVEKNVEVETPYGVSEITEEVITREIAKRSAEPQYPLGRAGAGFGIGSPGVSETVVEKDVEVETPYGVSEVAESEVITRGIAKRSAKPQYPLDRARVGLGVGYPGVSETVVERNVEVETPYGVSEVAESDVVARGIAKRSAMPQYPLGLGRAGVGLGIGYPGVSETIVERNTEVETPYGVSEVSESEVITRGIAKRAAKAPRGRAAAGEEGLSASSRAGGVRTVSRGV